MACNFFLLLVLSLFSFISTFGGFTLRVAEAQLVPAMYVFGDSLIDVGNNNYLPLSFAKANFYPYGIDFPNSIPTGRFCNGKNAVDLLAEKVGLPTPPPYLSVAFRPDSNTLFLNGVNFASAYAKIFKDVTQNYFQSISLGEQVDDYLKVQKKVVQTLGALEAQIHLSKSLFPIVIGSNDIYGYFDDPIVRNTVSSQQFANSMAAGLREQVKRLYDYGGRKFVILGVPPLGCAPSQRIKERDGNCSSTVNQMGIDYNRDLVSVLNNLKSELNGINFSYFDTYSATDNFIQNPAAYGFAEVKAACCGHGRLNADVRCSPSTPFCSNRSDHLFWDSVHPTEVADRMLVDRIFYGRQYNFPINVQNLVAV